MAKRAQTLHSKALAAFTTGRITRAEYQDVCVGCAVISRGSIRYKTRQWVNGRFAMSRLLGKPGDFK